MPQQSHMETAGGSQATSKRAASRKRKYDPKSQGNNSKNRNRRREKRQKRLNQTNPPSDSDVVEITALPPKEHVSSGRDVIAGTRRSGSATSAAPSASSGTRRFALMQSIMKDCSPATQKKFESTSSSTIKPSALNQVVIEDGTPEAAEEQHHLTIQYTRGKSVPAHSIEPELKSERESKVKGSQKRNNASFAIEIPPVRKNTLDSAWASGTVAGHRNGTTPIEVTSEDGSWYEAKTTIARANAAKLKSDDSVLPTIEEERSFRARSPTIHRFSSFGISPTPSAHGRLAPNEVDRKEQIATFEWEYDPGKVRGRVRSKLDNEDAEVEENIAFSSQYILERPDGVRLNGFAFQVRELEEGLNFQLPPFGPHTFMRICSVACGKVRVQLGGERFDIGENGMWRVRPEEGCIILNCGAGTATIHVTTVGFGLGVLSNEDRD